MSRVVDLLINAGSQNEQLRRQADDVIKKARDENIGTFLMELIYVLRDESIDSVPRRQALILLKNSVAVDAQEEENKRLLKARWKSVAPDTKNTIHAELLNTLGSADKGVRNITASVVANLARLELPQKEWPDLLDNLFTACQTEKFNESAIMTLGYICEESATSPSLEAILQAYSGKVLECVVNAMHKTDLELCYQGTKALCGSISFIGASMGVNEQRDFIMKSVLQNCVQKEDRIVDKALECLARISYEYYSILGAYVQAILDVTVQVLESGQEDLVRQAFEVWTSLCQVETELEEEDAGDANHHYASHAAPRVIPYCLKALLQQEEDRDEDEWDTLAAGGLCLQSFGQALGGDVIQHVISFITSNFSEHVWQKQDAAVTAFGGIIDGPKTEQLGPIIMQAFPPLLHFARSGSPKTLRLTAVWCISRIASFHPEVLISNFFEQTVHTAAALIQEGALIGSKACSIVHNLCVAIEEGAQPGVIFREEENVQKSNAMSQFFDSLVQLLFSSITGSSRNSHALCQCAQETLNSLISCAAEDVYPNIHRLIPDLVGLIKGHVDTIARMSDTTDIQGIDNTQVMLGLLCGTIQHIGIKLVKELSPEEGDRLMSALSSVLALNGGLLEGQPVMAVGSIASALKDSFSRHLQQASPFLLEGLKHVTERDLFKCSLGTVSDICWAVQGNLPDTFCDALVLSLLNAVQDGDIEHHCKLPVLSCFSDIAICLGPRFDKFTPSVLSAIKSFTAYVQNVADDNDTLIDFREDVVEASCEAMTGIIQGMNGYHAQLTPHVAPIANFIGEFGTNDKLAEKSLNDCVVLLGDLVNVFSSMEYSHAVLHELHSLIKDPRITAMIQRLKNMNTEDAQRSAQWTQEQILKFLQNYIRLTGS